jgi:hypothetical protein
LPFWRAISEGRKRRGTDEIVLRQHGNMRIEAATLEFLPYFTAEESQHEDLFEENGIRKLGYT